MWGKGSSAASSRTAARRARTETSVVGVWSVMSGVRFRFCFPFNFKQRRKFLVGFSLREVSYAIMNTFIEWLLPSPVFAVVCVTI